MPQYPLVGPTWGRVGLIDFDTEYGGDDVPRWVPVFAQTVGPTLYHMAVQLALVAADLDEQAVRLESDRLDAVRPDGSKAFSIPLRERQLVEVNWFSHWFSPEKNPRTSLADVADLRPRSQLGETGGKAGGAGLFRQVPGRYRADWPDRRVVPGPSADTI